MGCFLHRLTSRLQKLPLAAREYAGGRPQGAMMCGFLHGKKEEHYLGDTAEMKCSPGFLTVILLMLGQTHGDSVTQTEGQVTLLEEASLTMNCTYSTIGSPTLFWYVQYPGEGLKLLLKSSRDQEKKSNNGFEATLDSKSKSFHLEKGSVQGSDAAMYYCAMSDVGFSRLTFAKGTMLLVSPDITDPDPAVYQLKSPKSSKTSVCLFTDFDSEKKMPQSQEGTVIMSNGTVLDMRVMDSKSNGVLAWSNSTDFKCNSTFNEKFYSSSDFSCNATLIEKSFETDMNLNAHNLLVMGLRVLLLKVAGFNLFVTLRLWSR
ncbi:M1-specific T cell receptor alpha chain isoform X2 [Ailuropoda melanoleuca]|uniref:M1-specific T cell receptor alpha chain isoform X2 n=1 Tax=Ailuropoda melanoleuca TaxID=9646 RepID=UPI00149479C8|nr:M1-specific T cell receptor alpha chain isoform X2 [Ailuropoda melanoleuca]